MMQHCGFLTRRQDGRRTYYQVAEPAVKRIMGCIESRFGGDCVDDATRASREKEVGQR